MHWTRSNCTPIVGRISLIIIPPSITTSPIFGLLFGLGLYAQYQTDPEPFKEGYDDLLAATGMGDAAELAARFGIDIHQIDFWESSLDVLRADIDRFEKLIDGNG